MRVIVWYELGDAVKWHTQMGWPVYAKVVAESVDGTTEIYTRSAGKWFPNGLRLRVLTETLEIDNTPRESASKIEKE